MGGSRCKRDAGWSFGFRLDIARLGHRVGFLRQGRGATSQDVRRGKMYGCQLRRRGLLVESDTSPHSKQTEYGHLPDALG